MSWLRHPLLDACGVAYGFGTRACEPPGALVCPTQVHGTRVAVLRARPPALGPLGEADAVVSEQPGVPVGVVTADCLPILLATPSGRVAAVHAGWRGLAGGVIAAALDRLAELTDDAPQAVAVLGPHVAAECYEVDEPVVDALTPRFGGALDAALVATRRSHWRLDLGRLAQTELVRAGLAPQRVATLPDACTACDARRFHSYRRDGPRAGRLFHWVMACADGDRVRS